MTQKAGDRLIAVVRTGQKARLLRNREAVAMPKPKIAVWRDHSGQLVLSVRTPELAGTAENSS